MSHVVEYCPLFLAEVVTELSKYYFAVNMTSTIDYSSTIRRWRTIVGCGGSRVHLDTSTAVRREDGAQLSADNSRAKCGRRWEVMGMGNALFFFFLSFF